MHLKKLLALKPSLFRPIVLLLGFVSLLKLTGYKSVYSLLIGYKIPNKYLDDINAELKALYSEEISDEHRAILDDLDKKCSTIEGLRGLDPLSRRNIGGDGVK